VIEIYNQFVPSELVSIHEPNDAIANVIFVHGIAGDPRTTWHNFDNRSWPGRLKMDQPNLNLYSLGYDAARFGLLGGHAMPLQDRAINLLSLLQSKNVLNKPTAFVMHSMGGLVIKQMIMHAETIDRVSNADFLQHLNLLVFASTPHQGSDLASWTKLVSFLSQRTVAMQDLESNSPMLRQLSTWFREYSTKPDFPAVKVMYETKNTGPGPGLLVVDPSSADPGLPGVIPVPIDANHDSILVDDQGYKIVLEAIQAHLLKPKAVDRDAAMLVQYLEAFARAHRHLDFIGIPVREDQQEPANLEQVFVSLEAQEVFSLKGEAFKPDEEFEFDSSDVEAPFELAQTELLKLLSEDFLKRPHKGSVVIGGPGFGKSTALRAICLKHAIEASEKSDIVPIFVSLSEFAKVQSSGVTLERYMAIAVCAELNCSLEDDFFESLLRRKACLVCLDGLDEMFVDKDRRAVRQAVVSFTATYPLAHVIVSSRPIGYNSVALPFDQWRHFQVLPLGDHLIRDFLGRWFARSESDASVRAQMVDDLMAQIESRPSVHELARNPMLLTLIVLIYQDDKSLPDQRTMLFEKATELLLQKWQVAKEGGETNPRLAFTQERSQPYFNRLRYLLQRLALEAHTGANPGRLRRLPETELERVLTKLLMEDSFLNYENDAPGATEQAKRMIKLLLHATGLLVGDGHGRYSFPHLTFQEYLAAAALADEYIAKPEALFNFIQPHLFQPHWHEVLLLLLSRLGSRNEQAVQTVLASILDEADIDPLERMYGHHLRLLVEAVSDLVPISERLWVRLRSKIETAMDSGFDEAYWKEFEASRPQPSLDAPDDGNLEHASLDSDGDLEPIEDDMNLDQGTSAEFIWQEVSRLGFHPTYGHQVIALLKRVYAFKSPSYAASALIAHFPVQADLYKNTAEPERWIGEEMYMAVPSYLRLGDLLQIVEIPDHPIWLQAVRSFADRTELEGENLEHVWQKCLVSADPFHCLSFAIRRLDIEPSWTSGRIFVEHIIAEPKNPNFHYTVIHAAIWMLERDSTRQDCLDVLEGLAAQPGHPDCIQAIDVLLKHQPDRSDLLELLTWIVEVRPPVENGLNHYRHDARESLIAHTTDPYQRDVLAVRFNRDIQAMARLAREDRKWMLLLESAAKEDDGNAEAVRAILEIDPTRQDVLETFVRSSPFGHQLISKLIEFDPSRLPLLEDLIRGIDNVSPELFGSAWQFYSTGDTFGMIGTYCKLSSSPEPFLIEIASQAGNLFQFDAAIALFEMNPSHRVYLERIAYEETFGEQQFEALEYLMHEDPKNRRWLPHLELRLEYAHSEKQVIHIASAILEIEPEHQHVLTMLTDYCAIGFNSPGRYAYELLVEKYNRERIALIRKRGLPEPEAL
jgi:NACHT domain/PGAP1-like protein